MPDRSVLILVVEKDPYIMQLEQFFLQREGFVVEFAEDGESALKRAKELKPDLMITEILIPKLDGLQVCRHLKRDPETQGILVLMFSILRAREKSIEAGADAFLLKPFEGDKLLTKVKEMLDLDFPRETSMPHRLSTGEKYLDLILGGGIPENSINIIAGLPGTGKTVLAQQLLFANVKRDSPGLYLTTLSEPLEKVIRYLQGFSFFDEEKFYTAVRYMDIGAEVLQGGLFRVSETILAAMKEDVPPRLIVIDSFRALRDICDPSLEFRRMLFDLTRLFAVYESTTFWVGEYSPDAFETSPEFAVADGIVELSVRKSEAGDDRCLRVVKMRGSEYVSGEHSFKITPSGLEVFQRGAN